MKIIQSFWTKPIFQDQKSLSIDRLRGGWNNHISHFMSWALSCHQLRKFYNEVELVTDKLGEEILIGQLHLPYSNVRVELDQLNSFNSDLWALGKIYAYGIQTSPFLHVDGDVFIWKKFSNEIEAARLVCQNFDCNQVDYENALKKIVSSGFYIPDVVKDQMNSGKVYSCNAGMLGGRDLTFFSKYSAMSFDFVNRNLSKLNGDPFPAFNILFEQYLFYCLSKDANIDVVPYFQELDYGHTPNRYVKFWNAPSASAYVHVISTFKKSNSFSDLVANFLRRDHPSAYYRIVQLSKKLSL